MTLLDRPLTYPEIGATAGQLPDGYDHLRVHRVIGHGEPTFHRAAERLMSWQMHRAAGLTVEATTPRVEQGSRVRLRLGRHLLRISFGCQVVYVVEEERRRGFAYGTLQGHPPSPGRARGGPAPWRRSTGGSNSGTPPATCRLSSASPTTGRRTPPESPSRRRILAPALSTGGKDRRPWAGSAGS